MKKIFLKHKYIVALLLTTLFLLIINYKSQTYLLGWDNLQTDLHPWLGVKRAIFSVWEEYQSFGLLAGMAHASDLVRAIFIFLLSFILPQNLIRYFYHFFMVFLGGVGAYKLFSFLNKNPKKDFLAFLGALFYMLNLGTVQIFYVPFEAFSTFFASLPWLIWIFLKLLFPIERKLTKTELLLFLLINFLATPSFYAQQLFVVYLLLLGLIFIGKIITNLRDFSLIKKYTFRSIFLVSLILIVNSFWLLPQIYFLKTSSNVVYQAKANQLATEDVYFQNKEKGTLKYFLKLEGFYYDLFDKNWQPLFAPWKKHFKTLWLIQYLFALLMILGVIQSIRKKDFSFVFPFIFIAIVFLNATWPISEIDQFLRQNKLYNQIFRSPFTKFIIPYSLLYSYFLIKGFEKILSLIKPNFRKALTILFVFLIIFYSFPSFKGFFISPEMKVKIPQDYFELIEYFKKEDKNKRIALLPEYTLWGWFFTRWGLNGSGFLWYGIEQPIVSRTFDVWSNRSESYFWEVKKTIEAENLNEFEKILEKYNIDYLILDKSLLPVVSSLKGMQYDRINNLLKKSKKIKLVKNWKNLALYKVKQEKPIKNFVFLAENLPKVGPKIKLTNEDTAYLEYQDYIVDEKNPEIYYPFLDLITQTRIFNKRWSIKEINNSFIISTKIGINPDEYILPFKKGSYKAYLYKDDKLATFSVDFNVKAINNKIEIQIEKTLIEKTDTTKTEVNQCWIQKGKIKKEIQESSLIVKSEGGAIACFGYYFPFLEERYGYLIKIENKNLAGRRLFFYILDHTKKQAYIEDRLKNDIEYFIVAPRFVYGRAYSINFHNNSYENISSTNKLSSLEIYLLPYPILKKIKLIKQDFTPKTKRYFDQFEVKKLNYSLYKVFINPNSLNQENNLYLILSQSYHPGWKAYQIKSSKLKIKNWINTYFPFIFGKEIKEHVLVNNWANGWEVNKLLKDQKTNAQSLQVILIFWPQYLEFIGFALLFATSIIILLKTKKQKTVG